MVYDMKKTCHTWYSLKNFQNLIKYLWEIIIKFLNDDIKEKNLIKVQI